MSYKPPPDPRNTDWTRVRVVVLCVLAPWGLVGGLYLLWRVFSG